MSHRGRRAPSLPGTAQQKVDANSIPHRYMKYLYPYECEKRALSSPGELQAAIDSNRREGRRQTFGTALFNYSPTGTPTLLGSPKMPLPGLGISTHSCSQISQVHGVKKGG